MASRTRNFFRGLGAGYVAIAVNIAYTAASIPLALHYLGKEQFGLWALAQQIAGYLILLDLGVSSAVSRFIADRKDDVNSSNYASLMMTGAIVFASQGLLIVLVGAAFSFFAPSLFSIPPHFSADFTNCLIIITSIAGLSVVFRSLGAPLWAFQRVDVSYGVGSLSLILNFIALWFGFQQGWGIYSLALAGVPGVILSPIVTFWICKRNHYYPSAGLWGRPNWACLRQIFLFGQDVLWITIGSQLVNASQIMVLSRAAGLDAAATFSVGTKLFNMGQLLAGKVIDTSGPALTELFVRGDISRFNFRFAHVVSITAFVATIGAMGLMSGNTIFVSYWTSGSVQWSPTYDAFLAGLLLATSITRCLILSFGLMQGYRPVRHIYFLEGCVFIAVAIPAASHFGIIGVLCSSLLIHVLVSSSLGFLAIRRVLDSSALIYSVVASLIIVLFFSIVTLWIQAAGATSILTLFVTLVAFFSACFYIMPASFRDEICLQSYLIIKRIRHK
jgi:O-antigen/teichoic acid export membrane protein